MQSVVVTLGRSEDYGRHDRIDDMAALRGAQYAQYAPRLCRGGASPQQEKNM